MKQIVQQYSSGKLFAADVPKPALLPGGLLVKNLYSAVSTGTERMSVETARKSLASVAMERPDQVRFVLSALRQFGAVKTYRLVKDRLQQYSPLGYSCAGTVERAADDVEGFRPGDRVACAGAAYAHHAEWVYVPQNLCVHVPNAVSDRHASLVTPGAIALQGVRRTEAQLGEGVLVIGLGLLGQLILQLFRAGGLRTVGVDTNPERVKLARSLGFEACTPDDEHLMTAAKSLSGKGADRVVIAASDPSGKALIQAGKLARDRARIVLVGKSKVDMPWGDFYFKELEIVLSRSYGPGRYDPTYEEKGTDYPLGYVRWTEKRNMESFLDIAAQGGLSLEPLIGGEYGPDEAETVYERVLKGDAITLLFRYEPAPAPAPASKPAPKAEGIGLGVIGAGSFAQGFLLPHLARKRGVELVSVCTARSTTAGRAKERWGFNAAVTDPEELIADQSVNAVIIATRHDTHAELVCKALRAGKAVFCEKPLAIDLAGLRDVAAAVRETEGWLTVGFNRRFAPLALKMKAAVAGCGPLSLLVRVNGGALSPEHWLRDREQSGGRVVGEACHFVDFISFIAGAPVSVSAMSVSGGEEAEANSVLTLALADGSVAALQYVASGDRGAGKEYIEAHGGGVTAALSDFKSLAVWRAGKRRVSRGGGQDKGHKAEMRAFVSALLEGGPPPIPFESTALTTLATLKAVESMRTGESFTLSLSELAGSAGRDEER